MAEVTLPQLGETVTEGTITQWFKAVGENVNADEPLFEVSTDKVDTEVPSPVAGTLTEIRVPEGETVDVGTVIAVVSEGGEAPAAAAPAQPEEAAPAQPETAPAEPAAEAPAPEPEPEPAPAAAEPEPEPEPAANRSPAADAEPAPRATTAGAACSCAGERPPLHRPRPLTALPLAACSRRSCAGSSTSTGSIRRRSPAPGPAAASPVTTCSTTSTPRPPHPPAAPQPHQPRPRPPRPRRHSRPHPPRRLHLRHRRRPLPPARPGGAGAAASNRDEVVRLSKIRKLTGTAMLDVEEHEPARLQRRRGRLPQRRRHEEQGQGAVQGRRGVQPDLPAVHLPGGRRRPRRLPAPQRQRRGRRADRPRVRRPRHRRRPRLRGTDRPRDPRRRGQAARRHRPRDLRPRRTSAHEEAAPRRDRRRDVHDLQQRLGRFGADVPDHQPAAGSDPVDRRDRAQAGRRHPCQTAPRRSSSTPSATWRWPGTTGRSTAPTPPASSSASRRSSRRRTGPPNCELVRNRRFPDQLDAGPARAGLTPPPRSVR